jgi:hypothetical protein
LWWSGVSGEPLVAEVADALADRWDLADLSNETFSGLEVLASRAALDASQSQARSAQRLNVLLSYFAVISLALALLSFILALTPKSVDATTRWLLVVALWFVLGGAAAVGIRSLRPSDLSSARNPRR